MNVLNHLKNLPDGGGNIEVTKTHEKTAFNLYLHALECYQVGQKVVTELIK